MARGSGEPLTSVSTRSIRRTPIVRPAVWRPTILTTFRTALSVAGSIAVRALFPLPPIFPAVLVSCFLFVDELLAWVAMVTAWPPVPTTSRLVRAMSGRLFAPRFSRHLGRLPESSPGEPHQHGIGMGLTDSRERWQEFVAMGRSEGRREATGENRPIRIARWHQWVAQRVSRRIFSTRVVRFRRSNSAARWRLPPVRSSDVLAMNTPRPRPSPCSLREET